MDWITPHIAIGNVRDARSVRAQEVETLLCLLADCCAEEREDIEVVAVPFHDGAGNRFRDLRDAVSCIDETVRNGGRILVHCHAGRSRSAAVVAAYLMVCCDQSAEAALARIRCQREIWLSPGIEELLVMANQLSPEDLC